MFAKKPFLKKLLACLLISLFVFSLPVCAAETDNSPESQLKASVSRLLENDGYPLSNIAERDFLDWYIIGLSSVGLLSDGQKTTLADGLDKYIAEQTELPQIDSLRISLSYLALGKQNDFVADTADGEVNEQNLMCIIYSLLLCKNLDGYEEKCNYLAQKIIDLRIDNKGWSLTGKAPVDTDVTAMALTAISSYYDMYEGEIQASLEWLSSVQNSDGTFSSYGVKNAESTAQVIIALSAFGIDAFADNRFIKDSNLFDALLTFSLENGEFSHTQGGKANSRATLQSTLALCSVVLQKNGFSHIYDFDGADRSQIGKSILNSTNIEVDEQAKNNEENNDKTYIKYIVIGIIFLVALLLIINSLVRSGNKKRALIRAGIILLIAILLSVVVLLIRTTPKGDGPIDGEPITVTLSIECKNAVGKTNNTYIGNGIIAESVTLTVPDGCSVIYVLQTYCDQNDIHLDGIDAYISGIAHLYEKDCSSESGWLYFVNGVSPSVSVGDYTLSDGDKIEIRYTCNMGDDLK